ncbi:MAG: pilus assembly protein PilM [Oligoflexia bacterium]|nr:pilus assembly protein PilM [Oligoflexia bacterium]
MRILGIDLGSTSVKAVEIDSAFGRYEIRDYYEVKLEPEMTPAMALTRLMDGLPKAPDRIAVALPTRHLTFRNLKLPTRDRKAIQSSVGFELEDELPFPIDKSVYDYSILSQSKQGSVVHVAATLQRHLATSLESWLAAGIDPDLVTGECWAYRAFLNRVLPREEQEKPVLLAEIGHERTVLYVQWRGSPIMSREIPWGGRDLTQAISQNLGIPFEQAEAAKIDQGFVIQEAQRSQVTQEQADFSDILMNPLRELVSAIRQAELIGKNLTHENLGRIYLSGGTLLLPGLIGVIEEHTGIPAKPLQGLSSIAASGVTYSEHSDAVFLLAASTALCLVGTDRASTINFRKGEFVKKGRTRELNLSNLRRPLLAAGAVAASLIASVVAQSVIYKGRLQELDAQLERGIKTFFETQSSSSVRTYLSSTTRLRNSINEKLTRQKELGRLAGPNPRSPIEFLKSLSQSIPKDIVVDMTQFQVGAAPTASFSGISDQSATLSFIVASPQAADRLAGILGSKLTGLQKGKVEEVPGVDGGAKRSKVTFTGKPAEEAYGR